MSRRAADGTTARVYEGLRREFGLHAEPIVLHSPDPELLAGAWMLCRELLVAQGAVDRAVKEAAATRTPGAAVPANPPFGPREAPEMIGTALFFHYINRPVSVFGGKGPLAAARGRLTLNGMLWVGARRFRKFTRARPPQGATLDLLPPGDLPRGSPGRARRRCWLPPARSWRPFGRATEGTR